MNNEALSHELSKAIAKTILEPFVDQSRKDGVEYIDVCEVVINALMNSVGAMVAAIKSDGLREKITAGLAREVPKYVAAQRSEPETIQ